MEIDYFKGSFSANDFIKHLNLTGQGEDIYFKLIILKEVKKKAEELEIKVAVDDIQACVDRYRIARKLHSTEDTFEFLSKNCLTVEDLEDFCETTLLIEELKAHLANDQKIESYFVNNRSEFDLARISNIIVKSENLANEICMQVNEDGEDFHVLARKYSIDEKTKFFGGYQGWVNRNALSFELSAKVFNARASDVIGPFKINKGYQLILVEEITKPELDNRLKQLIREKIFKDWAAQFLNAGIRCKAEKG